MNEGKSKENNKDYVFDVWGHKLPLKEIPDERKDSMNNGELRKLLKETLKCLKIICGGIEPKPDVIRSVEKCANDIEQAIETIKFEMNIEYGNTHKPMVVESFPKVIFKSYPDESGNWYIIRCEYIGETNNVYIYKLGRRQILTPVSSPDEQFIMVKLSQRPTENDLANIWKEAVGK
ncbi:MAG: hypothetical protein IKU29_00525 [Parabacteroides sp.]|nr:hypothetical protein [Parabacteroides sp.]